MISIVKNIIMDITPITARTALVEDGKLVEILIDDALNEVSVGDIYVGRVQNIFSQFAFVDIGEQKKAFLSLDDIRQRAIYKEEKGKRKLNLQVGQQIVVQVLKEALGEKGASVTTELSFTGKYVVLIKIGVDEKGNVFVSKKIEDALERERLNIIASDSLPKGYSMIVRTSSIGATQSEIEAEIKDLFKISDNLVSKSVYAKPPAILYSESRIYANSLKSLLKEDINSIVVNSSKEFENITDLAKSYFRKSNDKVKLYEGYLNIFDEYEIETQIEKALNRKVWLKSGGFLVIEETEACVVIDINTGKLTGKKNKNDVILKNNMEAVTEISKQLRLRNLSGIIIIDFIDMKDEHDRTSLMSYLYEKVKDDRVGVTIVGMTSLGLVQLTRKKTRGPLSKYLLNECSSCHGTGRTYSTEYMVDRIYKQTCKILKQTIFNSIVINLNPKIHHAVSDRMEDFKELEEKFSAKIKFKKINTMRLDYFEIEKEKK